MLAALGLAFLGEWVWDAARKLPKTDYLIVLGILVVMIWMSWRLTLVAFVALPLFALVLYKVRTTPEDDPDCEGAGESPRILTVRLRSFSGVSCPGGF